MSDELITLDCYKDYKGINSSTKDGRFQNLILQVSALIESYCNRNFIYYSSNNKVEQFDAKTNKVFLNVFPVISVSSVTTSTDGGLTQTTLTENSPTKDGYYVDIENGTVMTQNDNLNFLTSYDTAYRSLEVTYNAGYTVETLPADLKLAVQDLVHYYDSNEKQPTQSLLGATVDNAAPYIANSFPPHIRRILDLYRYSPN